MSAPAAGDKFTWGPGDTLPSMCAFCARRGAAGQVCAAFPAQIPWAILNWRHDHRQPWLDADGEPGDVGTDGDVSLLFAPRDDVPPDVLARLYELLDRLTD